MTDPKWYKISDAEKQIIMNHGPFDDLSPHCGLFADGINGSVIAHQIEPLTHFNEDRDGLTDTLRYHNQILPKLMDEVLGCLGESICAADMLKQVHNPLTYLKDKHDYMTDTPAKVAAYKSVIASCVALMEVHEEFSTGTYVPD